MLGSDLISVLERIGNHLKTESRIVLIGSSIGILYGQPSRMTEDIDVWRPSSVFDESDLKQACEASDILFDPKDAVLGDAPKPYLQLINPGIVYLGDYRSNLKFAQFGKLEVFHPPIANVIASKLLRAEPRDIEDVIFLRRKFNISYADIHAAVDSLPSISILRDIVRENIVYLEVADSSNVALGE